MARHSVDRSGGLVSGYLPLVTFLTLLGVGVWFAVQPSPEVPPGRVELARLSPRSVAEAVSLNGIAAGARAAMTELARRSVSEPTVQVSAATASGMSAVGGVVVAAPDPTQQTPAIRLTGIVSAQPSDRASAKADALHQARAKLIEVFAALRSPVTELPDAESFEREYVPGESVHERKPTDAEKAAWRAEKLDEDRVWMVVSVSVSEEQLRHLRSQQRLSELSRWAVLILAVLTAAYGVLRATDGRGSRRLALLGVGVALAVVGVARLARVV